MEFYYDTFVKGCRLRRRYPALEDCDLAAGLNELDQWEVHGQDFPSLEGAGSGEEGRGLILSSQVPNPAAGKNREGGELVQRDLYPWFLSSSRCSFWSWS